MPLGVSKFKIGQKNQIAERFDFFWRHPARWFVWGESGERGGPVGPPPANVHLSFDQLIGMILPNYGSSFVSMLYSWRRLMGSAMLSY